MSSASVLSYDDFISFSEKNKVSDEECQLRFEKDFNVNNKESVNRLVEIAKEQGLSYFEIYTFFNYTYNYLKKFYIDCEECRFSHLEFLESIKNGYNSYELVYQEDFLDMLSNFKVNNKDQWYVIFLRYAFKYDNDLVGAIFTSLHSEIYQNQGCLLKVLENPFGGVITNLYKLKILKQIVDDMEFLGLNMEKLEEIKNQLLQTVTKEHLFTCLSTKLEATD